MIYSPSDEEVEALRLRASKLAGGDETLDENAYFYTIFNRKVGLYSDKGHRAQWYHDASGNLERIKQRLSCREWIETYFVIQAKDGRLAPMVLNRMQRRMLAVLLRMERRGVPMRIIALKARQMGCSTLAQAIMFERALRGDRVKSLIVADKGERAEMLLRIAETARTEMPKDADERWKFKMDSKAAYSLVWARPIQASIRITSAEVSGAGRGGTVQDVHLSETAWWPNAEKTAAGVLAGVPKLPGTLVINESTANGDAGWFRDDFWNGWNQRQIPIAQRSFNWESMFFAWWEHEEYYWSKSFGFGQTIDQRTEKAVLATLDEDEKWILEQRFFERGTPKHKWAKRRSGAWYRVGCGWKNPGVDQILWWRAILQDPEIHGDKNLRNQEYPYRPEVAFLSTGRKRFDAIKLSEYSRQCMEPAWVGTIEGSIDGLTPVA